MREGGSRSRKLSGAGGGRLFRDLDLLAEYMFSSSAYTADSWYGGKAHKQSQSETSRSTQCESTSDRSFPVGVGLVLHTLVRLLGVSGREVPSPDCLSPGANLIPASSIASARMPTRMSTSRQRLGRHMPLLPEHVPVLPSTSHYGIWGGGKYGAVLTRWEYLKIEKKNDLKHIYKMK